MAASIDDLPTELIAQIFVEAARPPERWPVDRDIQHTLRALLLVCRRWHDVAQDTPPLWRYINIDLDLITDAVSEARCRAYIDAFVSRAKGSVALSTYAELDYNPYHASIWLELRNLVGSICWYFSVEDRGDIGFEPQITACLDQVAPRLEVLHLVHYVELSEPTSWPLPRAPNLRELVWETHNTMFRWPSNIETFPLLRTVYASVPRCHGDDDAAPAAEIFSRCPHLVTLDLVCNGQMRSPSPIRLEVESLRTLNFHGDGLVSSLSALRLPNLENASVDVLFKSAALPALFGGPFATVTNLDIGIGVTMDDMLAYSLVHCTRLQHLKLNILDDMYLARDLAEFLEVMSKPLTNTNDWICPRLRSLILVNLPLREDGSLPQNIVTFARIRSEPSRDSETFRGRLRSLEHLVIIPPRIVAVVGHRDREYALLNSMLEDLGIATTPT